MLRKQFIQFLDRILDIECKKSLFYWLHENGFIPILLE